MLRPTLNLIRMLLLTLLRCHFRRLDDVETENAFLRYQIQVLKGELGRQRIHFHLVDRIGLSILGRGLKNLKTSCFLFRPETILAWHRQMVRWKWTYRKPMGRPPLDANIRKLILQMGRENRIWGIPRIRGELRKLGHSVAESTIRKILRQNGFDPVTQKPKLSWREFIIRHKSAWAMDFFTVETAFLKTLYVLVIIDIHSRVMIGIRATADPSAQWVKSNLVDLIGFGSPPELLIRDRDAIYGSGLNSWLKGYGTKGICTPIHAPKANCFVERLIGSVRRECTDHHLFFSKDHLVRVLDEYQSYYNNHRPHQGIDQRIPGVTSEAGLIEGSPVSGVVKTPFFGGLHHSYQRAG